jgi:hypothetical protein
MLHECYTYTLLVNQKAGNSNRLRSGLENTYTSYWRNKKLASLTFLLSYGLTRNRFCIQAEGCCYSLGGCFPAFSFAKRPVGRVILTS